MLKFLILSKKDKQVQLLWLKRFLIIFLVLINIGLLTAEGCSDINAWNRYAVGSIGVNPYVGYINSRTIYPLLPVFVISIFANSWKVIFGNQQNYLLPIKLSILIFYFLTVFSLIKFSSVFKFYKVELIDKLLVMLTLFSLLIHAQGLALIDVYVFPLLIFTLIALYRKRYFLSGFLMALSLLMKWQPVVFLPVIAIYLFSWEEKTEVLKHYLMFGITLLTTLFIVWYPLWMFPGAEASTRITLNFLRYPPFLSGLALNLNWIVTYGMRVLHVEGYTANIVSKGVIINYPISGTVPFIWSGILMYIAVFILLIRYFFIRKEIKNFYIIIFMLYFSHFILSKGVHTENFIYPMMMSLFVYLVDPTPQHRQLLILFDVMNLVNIMLFNTLTGPAQVNLVFYRIDISVVFSAYFVFIYIVLFYKYLKKGYI